MALKTFEEGDKLGLVRAKLTSMLALGHAMDTSGKLLKTAVISGMNFLALDRVQMLAIFPATVTWMGTSPNRDPAIRSKPDAEWVSSSTSASGTSWTPTG